jgi:hypothetical protein
MKISYLKESREEEKGKNQKGGGGRQTKNVGFSESGFDAL